MVSPTVSSPSRSGAAIDAAATKSAIETHTRAAQAAFRRQDLATAIREWDQVIALDPANDLARAKRQEAIELDRRAKQLK
jgi:cytochrome c-type biogenesis protein CcmH/NrfG